MAFQGFESFLKKFSLFLIDPTQKEKKIGVVLKEFFPKSNFSLELSGRVLIIHTTPSLQSEVFIKKEDILAELKKILGPRAPHSINFRPL